MSKETKTELSTREAIITPATVDAENRTVEMVFSAGTKVRRYNWWREEYYDEELSLAPGAVRMERMNGGLCPLLDSHNSWSLRSGFLGAIAEGSGKIANGEGRCIGRFSARADVEPIFLDVKAGLIRGVSVGYRVHKYERIAPVKEGDVATYRAVDWEPYEVSLVGVPADAAAGVRSEKEPVRSFPCEIITVETRAPAHNPEVNMTTKAKDPAELPAGQSDTRAAETATAPSTAAAAPANAATAEFDAKRTEEIRKEERTRIAEIETIARVSSLGTEFVKQHTDAGTTIDKVRAAAFEELAKRSAAPGEVRSYGQNAVAGDVAPLLGRVENAVLHRCRPQAFKLEEGAREFRGMNLMEIARDLLERRGVRVRGMGRFEIATAALGLDGMRGGVGLQGGSDLANILANVMNKSLRRAYDVTPRTFTGWAGQSSNPDFKQITRTLLSGAPSLLQVKAGAEYKRGAVTDGKEVYQLATFGRTVAFTREALINDDLNALDRIPALMGNAAADLESDTVYAILTANAALGDGVALFHATHTNLTNPGTAIAVASLGVGRAAMRQQKGLEGRHINLRPAYLIVPTSLEQIAYQFTSADFVPATSGSVNEFKQGGKTALEPVVEPRLDASSAVSWYLSASPSQIDTVEYCYLEGNEGVLIESRVGFEVDGVELKVRHDFAAKALDHRGVHKNNGA